MTKGAWTLGELAQYLRRWTMNDPCGVIFPDRIERR
jgi:hypothetical protein